MNKSEIAGRAAREQFEKWVTAMEPAYADQNLERMTGGRGSYRVHNVHCWWMGWKEGWERAIAESHIKYTRHAESSLDGCDPKNCQNREHFFYELGDGEPSPPPAKSQYLDKVDDLTAMLDKLRPGTGGAINFLLRDAYEEGRKSVWSRQWDESGSGAAQEVSPVGSVYEIRPRPDDPSCHICGAQMAVKEWKCLSCKATSGAQEVSPPANMNIGLHKLANEEVSPPSPVEILKSHWLMEIVCDHSAKTDQPLCACGWRGPVCSNVGNAVTSWANHAAELIRGDTRELKAALTLALVVMTTDNRTGWRPLREAIERAEKLLG